jgi:hypothetical protein
VTWELVEQHGCWWAYEGEPPPPEAFTTHGRARHILGPFPTRAMAEQQLPRLLSRRETPHLRLPLWCRTPTQLAA